MSLIIDSVSKRFGEVQALDAVSLEMRPGEVFGFLGANGAGKTTAMRIVLDILRPDSGTITWNGKLNTEASRGTWGYLPEERGLYAKMKVLDQLVFFAKLHGVTAEGGRARDSRLARALPDPGVRRPSRRAALQGQPAEDPVHRRDPPRPRRAPHGRAVHRPGSGQRRAAQGGVSRDEGRGKTLVFSTHQMETVEELCQSIAILDRGRVVVGGAVARRAPFDRSAGGPAGRRGRSGDRLARDARRRSRHQARPGLRRGGGGPGPRPGNGPASRSGAQLPSPPFRDRRPFARGDLHRARRSDRHERENARPEGGATHERLAQALSKRLVRRRSRVPQPGHEQSFVFGTVLLAAIAFAATQLPVLIDVAQGTSQTRVEIFVKASGLPSDAPAVMDQILNGKQADSNSHKTYALSWFVGRRPGLGSERPGSRASSTPC